jgi:hypothetical protein
MLCNFEGIKTPNLYYIYSLYSYHNFSKIALMRRVMSAERTRRNHSLISTWYLSILNLRACPPNLDVVASKRKPFKAAGIAWARCNSCSSYVLHTPSIEKQLFLFISHALFESLGLTNPAKISIQSQLVFTTLPVVSQLLSSIVSFQRV